MVITMLPTAPVILNVVEPLLKDWPEDTIWLQMSGVGAAEADHLTQVAEAHAVKARRSAGFGQHSSGGGG
jgi:3-hydroxyisobutyrate dehydrogenase-like beta-hydroxyacid dehydrogenase